MIEIQKIDTIIRSHRCKDYRWFDPQSVVVSQWVRMKCTFGCTSYGQFASCPPNTPSIEECQRFFSEYKRGIVFHFRKVAPEREARTAWSAKTNLALLKVEREVFLAGYPKAFLLFLDSCHLCPECTPRRSDCKQPKLSRPSVEGMAVDVFTTVRRIGYPIEVLTDTADMMNRYAFLLVE